MKGVTPLSSSQKPRRHDPTNAATPTASLPRPMRCGPTRDPAVARTTTASASATAPASADPK